MLAGITALGIIGVHEFTDYGEYWTGTILCTSAGFGITCREDIAGRVLSRHFFAVTAILFAIILSVFTFGKIFGKIHYLSILLNVALSLLVYSLVRGYGFPRLPVFIFLGGISLEIYLVHGLVIYGCDKLSLSPLWMLVITFALSIPAAMSIKKYCRFPLPRGKKETANG